MTFSAELSRLPDMIRFVDAWCENARLSDTLRYSLWLVVDELVSNICRYSSVLPAGTIMLTLFHTDNAVTLEIRDSGIPFNPLDHLEPDMSLPLAERPIGGLGLLIVRRLAQTLIYQREEEKNILTIVLANRDAP